MTLPTQTIHKADCDVWDLPGDAAQDRLHPATGHDPATDRYLAGIAPAYDGLARVMAQLSGMFLLALTRDGSGQGLSLDHAIYAVARDQLAEAAGIVAGSVAPGPARRHRAGLVDLADLLAQVASALERMAVRRGPSDKRDILQRLAAAQRLLIATAAPQAGITPVDFDNACCNCAMTRRTG